MHTDNTMDFEILQAPTKVAISALAGLRVGFERIRASETGRKVCFGVLAALFLTLWTVVTFRVAQRDAQERFEAWQTRFVNDYMSMQEVKEIGLPPDPKEEQRKQEANAFAKLMAGLKLYDYGTDDFRTLAQCLYCRKANPQYPNTLIEVIEQPKQWPGYSDSNEVTQKEYNTALSILEELDAQEHPTVSNAFVYASFEREGITLRDTWEIGTRTRFWRAGE